MLKIIQGHEADQYSELLDQMFRLRAKVFKGRLDWEVEVVNDRERDRFDDADPLYVLSLTPDNKVVGCLRLLQTTGPTMLGSVFSEVVPDGLMIRSPLVWESTRFCVDTELVGDKGPAGINRVTSELICCAMELGNYAGLTHIVTVVDARMERVLRRSKCPIERLGPPKRIGKVMTLAVLVDCSEGSVQRTHELNDLVRPIVSSKDTERLGIAV